MLMLDTGWVIVYRRCCVAVSAGSRIVMLVLCYIGMPCSCSMDIYCYGRVAMDSSGRVLMVMVL